MFTGQELQAQIDKVMEPVPAGTSGAFVLVANLDEVKVLVVKRFDHGWTVTGELARKWKGPVRAEVEVVKTW